MMTPEAMTSPPSPRGRPRRRGAPPSIRLLLAGGLLAATWTGAQEPEPAPTEGAAAGGGVEATTARPAEAVNTNETGATPPGATPGGEDDPRAEEESLGAVASGGLRVFVDPVTGAIRSEPSPEQVRALEALERQRLARPATTGEREPVRLFAIPGGVGADLPERLLSATVLRVRPDGSFETSCVDHSAASDHDHPIAGSDEQPPPGRDKGEEIR